LKLVDSIRKKIDAYELNTAVRFAWSDTSFGEWKIKEKEKEIEELSDQLATISEKRLLKEEVDAEDIAEIVAKATTKIRIPIRLRSGFTCCSPKVSRLDILTLFWSALHL